MHSDYHSKFGDEFDVPRHQRVFAGTILFSFITLIYIWMMGKDELPETIVTTILYTSIMICGFVGFFPEYSDDPLALEPTQPETFRERFALAMILVTPIANLYILYAPIDLTLQKVLQSLFIFVITGAAVVGMDLFEKDV